MPSVAELMNALPQDEGADVAGHEVPPGIRTELSMRSVPVGRLRRIGLLASLQSKIFAAYLFYWVRGWFNDAAERERQLAETHWRTAVRVLDSMSYLRGATMKFGQTLGNFPHIVPAAFVETLEQLHFNAPPMHFSLLREMVFNELGDDPENVFASFDKRAFAAASLGQVHGARLKGRQEVAIKIQYPGIARAIAEDFQNLFLFLFPARLGADWENVREQFEDLRLRLQRETDYQREARTLQTVRALFRDDEGIVIPRVFPDLSTGRVLTMEMLDGVHLDRFLAGNPSQETRNEFARKLVRALYRMFYGGRLLYSDLNPGNFIFMNDGRLGIVDFGFMLDMDDGVWELMRKLDRPQTTGRREDRAAVLKEWHYIGEGASEEDRLRLTEELADWYWQPRYTGGGSFDYGDEAEFRRGIDLMVQAARKRYARARSCMFAVVRANTGIRSILYRLNATIDVAPIAEEEVRATGWDRSDYAPR